MARGAYICIEGCDYSGKGHLAQVVTDTLLNELDPNPRVFNTREPGSTHDEGCVAIRRVLGYSSLKLSAHTIQYLFLADAYNHLYNVLVPQFAAGSIVVSDRGRLSGWVCMPEALRPYFIGLHKTVFADYQQVFDRFQVQAYYIAVTAPEELLEARREARGTSKGEGGVLQEYDKINVHKGLQETKEYLAHILNKDGYMGLKLTGENARGYHIKSNDKLKEQIRQGLLQDLLKDLC